MTLVCNVTGIRKSEFVAKTQFLWVSQYFLNFPEFLQNFSVFLFMSKDFCGAPEYFWNFSEFLENSTVFLYMSENFCGVPQYFLNFSEFPQNSAVFLYMSEDFCGIPPYFWINSPWFLSISLTLQSFFRVLLGSLVFFIS